MTTPKLKPCPFCGASGDDVVCFGPTGWDLSWRVHCYRCSGEMVYRVGTTSQCVRDRANCVRRWNRRAKV